MVATSRSVTAVITTQSLLSPRLDEAHVLTLQEGIVIGYSALAEIIRGTPVLATFSPGRGLLGHLADPCVQYGIELVAKRRETFYTEQVWNNSHNHVHTRFQAPGVCLTTHFMGRDASRKGARKAVSRGEIAKRCTDLFATIQSDLPAPTEKVYAHLLHGGDLIAKSAVLAIPDQSQENYPLLPWALDLGPVENLEIEEVADTLQFAVRALHSKLVEGREAG